MYSLTSPRMVKLILRRLARFLSRDVFERSKALISGVGLWLVIFGMASNARPQSRFPGPGQVLHPSNCDRTASPAAGDTQYRNYAEENPASLYILGEVLTRAQRPEDAAAAFRALIENDSDNLDARLGLAHALSMRGCYATALQLYDEVLEKLPASDDGLRGKAFVLLWTKQDSSARPILRQLEGLHPEDQGIAHALATLDRRADRKRWAAADPGSDAPPQARMAYYISYLADHPDNARALHELAIIAGRLNDYSAAITAGRRALQADPRNFDIQSELASILAWDHQYDAAIALNQQLLREAPGDRPTLENLARVYAWSGRLRDALSVEKELSANEPSTPQFQLEAARLEVSLHDDVGARHSLKLLLRGYPLNRQARLALARLDMREGRLEEAAGEFENLLGQNFQDPEALYGAAEINYYNGRLRRALPLATNLVSERPRDLDALLLLARIERALHMRKAALALVNRASQVKPGNHEVDALRAAIREDNSVTVHTAASYAREVSAPGAFPDHVRFFQPPGTGEDLNTYGAETRVSFAVLPRSTSYVLTALTPSNSPVGGIQGTAAPAELLYGQTTQLASNLTARGGIGLTRMGPGEFFVRGNYTRVVPSTAFLPVGYAALSLLLDPKIKLDLSASQTAITYTPTSTRLGARQKRVEATLNYQLDSRTQASMSVFHNWDSSAAYYQTAVLPGEQQGLERNGRDSGSGMQLTFTRSLINAERFSFNAGYQGLAFGYAGQHRGVFMGFFNPDFYQQHLATTRFSGELWGPVSYELTADAGLQQTGEGNAFNLAARGGPGLTFRLSPRFSVSLSYLYYNFAEPLGNVTGNAVQFSTDYRF